MKSAAAALLIFCTLSASVWAQVPTPLEQYLLYLVNRARANPAAELQRWADAPEWNGARPDWNEKLPAGTISMERKAPLAWNTALLRGARAHSAWMLGRGKLSHSGEGGSRPVDRMRAGGYPFAFSWMASENVGMEATTQQTIAPIEQQQMILGAHRRLLIDATDSQRGHRRAIFDPGARDVGVGIAIGASPLGRGKAWQAIFLTQDFAASTSQRQRYGVGVVWRDANSNGVFDLGEGIAGCKIAAEPLQEMGPAPQTTADETGMFQLALRPGGYQFFFTDPAGDWQRHRGVNMNDENVWVDERVP